MGKYDYFTKGPRRLRGYDYRREGLYFITICTKDRYPYFGKVVDGEMILSEAGVIVSDRWFQIPIHHPHAFLGEFVVMPNHIHGIIGIESVKTPPASVASMPRIDVVAESSDLNVQHQYMADLSPSSGSLSRIIGSYKSGCTRQINQDLKNLIVPFAWQPRFHDHIIRTQQSLRKIEGYILTNPETWPEDLFFR